MTFNQWWGSLKWSFIMRIFVEPPAKVFAKIAWNAAVRFEREACAKLVEADPSYDWHKFACEAAAAIRARGRDA